MKSLTRTDLQTLLNSKSPKCVSIYMPTHRAGKEIREDPIRLKNLIKDATEQLQQLGTGGEECENQLRELMWLVQPDSHEFWRHSSDGLAAFCTEETTQIFRVPVAFEPLVVVAGRFHLKPLLAHFQGDGRYFVLAASQNRVRLLEGNKHRLVELEHASLPSSLAEALNIDEYQSSLQFHSHSAGVSDNAPNRAIYHGQGGGSDEDQKTDLLRYFHKLDNALQEFFTVETFPLVFAGVDFLFPIFQQANSYKHLVEIPLTGNYDQHSAEELHQPSWQIVKPLFDELRKNRCEAFGTLAAQDKASNDLADIVTAARAGRIEALLLLSGEQKWGTVDENDGSIQVCSENQADNEDLLDYAAVQTLQAGGNVYLYEGQGEMPTPAPFAALFRYSL